MGLVVRGSDGETKSLQETRPDEKNHSASEQAGEIVQSVTGPAPRNEEGALEVCQRLARGWSNENLSWEAVLLPPGGDADCLLRSATHGQQPVRVHVTRARDSQSYWRELGQTGAVASTSTAADIVSEMWTAVAAKVSKYPKSQRAALILLLDASRVPEAVLGGPISAARADGRFRSTGFAEIWVVGPLDSTERRLDVDPSGFA